MARAAKGVDADAHKGANEERGKALVSYSGQLPHRGTLPLVKEYDSDFPEPGASPEHSGESGKKKRVRRSKNC
ncbi:MAG TPA: hypothetical protein VLA96_06850 [Terriglobales bacterium]|nr:hypothetical protein [Terriglobales bacterium]